LAAAFAEDPPGGLLDAVPGARTLLLLYDPDLLDIEGLDLSRRGDRPPPRVIRLQACYDGADLDEVARELGMRREEVVRGHVAARMFDPAATPPSLLRPGDRVLLEPVERLAEPPPRAKRPKAQGAGVLRVVTPGAFTSVQGGPRYGLAASGVPAGGAMDLASLAAANRALGNDPFAPALEITLVGPDLEASQDVRVARGTEERSMNPGERVNTGLVPHGG